jgi:hypothetical protein
MGFEPHYSTVSRFPLQYQGQQPVYVACAPPSPAKRRQASVRIVCSQRPLLPKNIVDIFNSLSPARLPLKVPISSISSFFSRASSEENMDTPTKTAISAPPRALTDTIKQQTPTNTPARKGWKGYALVVDHPPPTKSFEFTFDVNAPRRTRGGVKRYEAMRQRVEL